jgi:hypothetical protein
MTVLEFARHRLKESERQMSLGSEYAHDDIRYWVNYIEGAERQKEEFENMTDEIKDRLSPAIATLELMATNLVGALAPLEESDPKAAYLSRQIDAIDTAQEAIRLVQRIASGRDSPSYSGRSEEGTSNADFR